MDDQAPVSAFSAELGVLRVFSARLEGSGITWAVTGSLGFALQGVPVECVHDIDIQTDAAGAYAIEERFSDAVVRPVVLSSTRTMRSHFGELRIGGVKVEIMGDIAKRSGEGEDWDPPAELPRIRRWVELDGQRLPVLDLAYECQAYARMGRMEKAEALRRWLERKGPIVGRYGMSLAEESWSC